MKSAAPLALCLLLAGAACAEETAPANCVVPSVAPAQPAPAPATPARTDPNRQETPSVLLPGKYHEDRIPLKPGDVAPGWVLPFASDSPHAKKAPRLDFAKWRGRGETVVVFWAFWCDTWKDATKFFGAVRGDLEKNGTKLVVINVDASQQPVARSAFASGKLYFPVVIDTDSVVTARWNVRRVPTLFVVGPDGKVRLTWEGLPYKKAFLAGLR